MVDYSQFDLFDSPKYNDEVVEYDEIAFYPDHLKDNDNGPYEITVVGNGVHFMQLNKARLEVSLRYRVLETATKNYSALGDKHDSSVVPFIATSMFQNVRFKIANIETPELTQSCYAYKAYLEEVLANTKENEDVYMRKQLGNLDLPGLYDANSEYWKDFSSYTSTNAVSLIPKVFENVTVSGKTITNYDPYKVRLSGVWQRKDTFKDNNPLFISSPLHIDFLNQQKCFPPNFSMTFIFEKHITEFFVLSLMDSVAIPELTIEKMRIVTPIVKLHPDLASKLLTRWNNEPISYHYQYVVPRTYHLAQGSLFWEDREICQGVMPKAIYFVFVKTENYNGKLDMTPYKFENLSLTRFELTKNSQVINSFTLEADFNTNDALQSYNHFLKHAKKEREDTFITNKHFKNDYTIIPFDLTTDFNNNYNLYEPTFATLGVNVKFPALTSNYVAIAFFVYNKCLELDKHLRVSIKDI
jgi:hypothetical protein